LLKARPVLMCAVVCCALSNGSPRTNVVDGRDLRSIQDVDLAARIRSQPLRFEEAALSPYDGPGAVVRARGYSLRLSGGGETFVDVGEGASPGANALRFRLVDAAPVSDPVYEDRLPGISNYFLGNEPAKWRTAVAGYARVRYPEIYPGIDLVYYGREGDVEYDFNVRPGADPSRIALRIGGADAVSIDASGDIVVSAGGHELRHKRPVIYQQRDGGSRILIDGRWTLDGTTARFDVGHYDASQSLVIDPVLTYATYLGTTAEDSTAAGIDIDRDGNMYVLGSPQPGGPLSVSKFSADGSRLEYTTYLGGAGQERPGAIEVDPDGNAYLAAEVSAPFPPAVWDFPTVLGSYGAGCSGTNGCEVATVVVKIDASGSRLLHTAFMNRMQSVDAVLGFRVALSVDSAGRAVVAGGAPSAAAMPLVNAAQPIAGGSNDAFVFKLNAAGTGLEFSTWLGGEGWDHASAIDLDPAGNAYVVGRTTSTTFPLVNALQAGREGSEDAFLAVYSPSGQRIRSTYFGGNGREIAHDVAVALDGSLAIAGLTGSTNFRLRNPAQSILGDGFESLGYFVTRLDGANLDLGFSTYLGRVGNPEFVYARRIEVALDDVKNVYVLTTALSTNLPLARPIQPQHRGGDDLYFVKFSAAGTVLHGTYLGGTSDDQAVDLVIDQNRAAFVAANTVSVDVPLVNPLQGPAHGFPQRQMYIVRMRTATPVVTGIAPAAIPPGTAPRIKLTGIDFLGHQQVFIGGQPATAVVVNNSASIDITAPALPAGVYDVAIVNAYGEQTTLANAVFYGTCQVGIAAASQRLIGSGGRRRVDVQSNGPFCQWAAQSSASWISLDVAESAGPTALWFTVAPNVTTVTRTGTISVGSTTVTVTQGPSTSIDVNADGNLDLLWQHQTTGDLAAWLMNGASQTSGLPMSPSQVPDTTWKIAGAGDLDGDGHADLVWQNADGRIAAWLMNGLTRRSGSPLGPGIVADLGWRIRSVGDADADGKADLYWQHTGDGRLALWLMDGLQVRSADQMALTVSDLGWQIVGGGDFDSDGRRDLLWQHADGRLAVWTMDAGRMLRGEPLVPGTVGDTDWKVRAVGDINADGRPDLLWRHETTGHLSAWIMNGLSQTSGAALNPAQVADTNWRIVAQR